MSGNKVIKHSAIPRVGYEYQDLIGIDVLIRYYRDPNLYEWVQIESDEPGSKALDDVIAKRKDGAIEYVQVKFTVDPMTYALNWDWLLSKKKSGTSMLAKWAKSLARAKASGPIHSAQLKTNRIPSSDFAACLNGSLVDLSKVPASTLELIEAQCGGKAQAADFFQTFAFTAALPDLEYLETSLRDQLVPTDTDIAGWLLLRNEVTRWAIFQREPPPDGKIQREHVVRLISQKRPRPIRQDFFVPDDYTPPCAAFHEAIRTRVANNDSSLTVIWGSPGRGKSTYLSYLTSNLEEKGDAVIRHHYFLSADDSSANRVSYVDIAASLYHQLFSHYPELTEGVSEDPDELRLGLSIAAQNGAREGKRLYLIVDGLDHVYRDTHRTDQLNHLFNVLFPLPDQVSLIVGTQRVADNQLPAKLLLNAQDDDWIEIPKMDEVAVRHWVESQDQARPILVRWIDHRPREIEKIGAALFNISKGHPLHLIYSFEGLIRSGIPLDGDAVKALPSCPDGDIRNYYKSLWLQVGEPARAVLHVLAGSGFFWPSLGIRQCIGDYGEVAFLLEPHNSGMMPFHGSIFAWIKERDDHEECYKALLPKVIKWLEKDAPDYWRWGWLWLARASAGDADPLLNGTTRDWAVDSLVNGWPEIQIQNILAAAERLTFLSGDLPSTVRLRALKTRVSNVREYQAWNYGVFRSATLSIADNRQQALNMLDSLGTLTNDEIASLARYCPEAHRKEIVDACYIELDRRINIWIMLRHRPFDDFSELSSAFLKVAALAGIKRVPQVMSFLKGYREPRAQVLRYVEYLAQTQDIESLTAVDASVKDCNWISLQRNIQEHILRTVLFIRADPLQFIKQMHFEHSPFVAGWFAVRNTDIVYNAHIPLIPDNLLGAPTDADDRLDLEGFFIDGFWIALRLNKLAMGRFSLVYPGLRRGKLGFVDTALDCLEACASELAADEVPWTFSTPFIAAGGIATVPFSGRSDSEHASYLAFRKALSAIALDIHLIGLPDRSASWIPSDELTIARGSVHWVDEVWIDTNAESRVRYLSRDAAKQFLDDMAQVLTRKVSIFNERADQWTKYAILAHLYGVGDPLALLRRASSCLLGYGYRKDMFAFEVLASIQDVHHSDSSETLGWLQRVVPIVDRIADFTDGDETRHARSELVHVVAETRPEWLPLFYQHHLDQDEWHYADECLESFLGIADLATPEAAALSGTLLDFKTLDTLRMRANDELVAEQLLEKQTRFLGGFPLSTERDYSTPDRDLTGAEKEATSQDPAAFAAEDFASVAKAVGEREFHYSKRKDFLEAWLRHWHSQGKSRAALTSINAYFVADHRTYDVDELLDTAFEVSLEAEGREAAYTWLVMAHIRRHGWQRYYTSHHEVDNRLRAAASIYPERWMDFIHDTSAPQEYYALRGYSFSIGFHYLVRFLLFADQIAIAKKVTAEFVSTFDAETEDQPIEAATWFR